jgi:hypothetical protein
MESEENTNKYFSKKADKVIYDITYARHFTDMDIDYSTAHNDIDCAVDINKDIQGEFSKTLDKVNIDTVYLSNKKLNNIAGKYKK